MCRFIETLRVEDGQVQNLAYHTARLNQTRSAFWKDAEPIDLCSFVSPPNLLGTQKCRIVYALDLEEVVYTPYQPRDVRSLRLIFSDDIEYGYKSLNRKSLNQLFIQRETADDILLVKHGYVTDTSIANVALYDGNDWFTPAHPLLRGTKRAELLDKQQIIERKISVNELNRYSHIMLFNAMIDWGRISLPIQMGSTIDMNY